MINKNLFEQTMNLIKKKLLYILLIISLLLNLCLFYYTHSIYDNKKHPLLDKGIILDNKNDLIIRFTKLHDKLHEKTDTYGKNFSLYFEYLHTGASIGINQRIEFFPASLTKLPLAIAYYNGLEDFSKAKTDRTATITQKDIDKGYGTLWKKGVGYKIPLSEVVRLMLEQSDNTATRILTRYLSIKYFYDLYKGLDVSYTDGNKFIVTTLSYSTILKSLYYASILSQDNSQLLLNYLTHSNDNNWLPAGVPEGITIAHKVGINPDYSVYQDCGIVYLPRRPYILCMMSQSDENTAEERMVSVSKLIYDYVSSVSK